MCCIQRKILQLIKAEWISFNKSLNVSLNPQPNYASGNGGVNSLEIGKKSKAILRVTMDRLYGMMRQARYFKTPVRTQVVRDANEYCKYHQQFGHDINYCEEFHSDVEDMMTLGVLRLMMPKENNLVGIVTLLLSLSLSLYFFFCYFSVYIHLLSFSSSSIRSLPVFTFYVLSLFLFFSFIPPFRSLCLPLFVAFLWFL
jgi:hypothetical protein